MSEKPQQLAAQPIQQVSPMAALLALSGRHEAMDGYYINRTKVLEQEKLLLQERIAELEQELAALMANASSSSA